MKNFYEQLKIKLKNILVFKVFKTKSSMKEND